MLQDKTKINYDCLLWQMKEKMLSTAASRSVKSPVKTSSNNTLPATKHQYSYKTSRSETDATVSSSKRDDRINVRMFLSDFW